MIDFETEFRKGMAAFLPELNGEILRQMLAVDLPQRTASGVELIGFSEAQAAEALSVPRSVLRDLRLAGRIKPAKLGRRFVYARSLVLELAARGAAESDLRPVPVDADFRTDSRKSGESSTGTVSSSRKRKGAK